MTDDAGDDRPPGPFDRLRELIEALQDLDDDELDDAVRFDYDYDVRVGLGGDDADRRASRWNPNRGRDRSQDREEDRTRTVDVDDVVDAPGRTYHVDVEEGDEEVVIKADLPGVDREELSVDVEDDAVLVRVDGEVVEEVPVRWDDGTVTDVSFRNAVLVVTLSRAGGDPDE